MTALQLTDPPVEIGATWRLALVYEARIGGNTYAAIDLTNCHARAQFRRRPGDDDELATLTDSAGGGIVLGGASGAIDITLTSAQTSTFPTSGFVSFDLLVRFPSGEEPRLVQGRFQVSDRVTMEEDGS